VIRDGFLGPALALGALAALAAWQGEGRLSPGGVGRGGTPSTVRGDHTAWVEPSDGEPLSTVFGQFDDLRVALTRDLRLGLQRFSLQAAHYPAGARYAPHRDAFRGDRSRVLTAIVYLNPQWHPAHGGLLRAETPAGPVQVEPVLDRVVLFRSEEVLHEVSATTAPRWALTAWYRGAEDIPILADPSLR
jgi:SM-20-related protein